MFSLALALFVTVAIVLVGFALLRERGRRSEVERIAAAEGLRFEEHATDLARTLAAIPSIAAAPRQRFSNVLRGSDEIVADWTIERPIAEKKRRLRHQTLVAIRREGAEFPSLRISPRKTSRERLEGLSVEPVTFGEAPDGSGFDQRYRVEALDRARARAWLDADRRARLAPIADLVLELGDDWLVGYRAGSRLSASELPAVRERVRRIADQLVR